MVKKFNDYIKENHDDSESELGMAYVHLEKIMENSSEIKKELENIGEDIPAWVQDKLSVSNHNMQAINDWILSNEYTTEKVIQEGKKDQTIVPLAEINKKQKTYKLKLLLEKVYEDGQSSMSSGENFVIDFQEYWEENKSELLSEFLDKLGDFISNKL